MATELADLIDLSVAWKRFKDDLPHRVFICHPYELVVIESDLESWIEELLEEVRTDRYRPRPLVVCDVPKGRGIVRPGAHFRVADGVMYAACLGACFPYIHKALSWSQGCLDFSYLLSESPNDIKWIHGQFEGWRSFQKCTIEAIDQGMSHVVFTDIAAYYENIDLSTLMSDLRQTGSPETVVLQLYTRLSRNGIDTKRYFGYPGGMKTADTLSLMHERVDDIPLLLGFMQQLNFPDLLERHLGSHHLHKGLSNGWLATVWLAFLLSQSNHRKVSVQDWAQNHIHTLETLIGQSLRPIEFADDRLSIILRRLHDADWSALEADLWQATCEVYEISYECIRLDATTSFGYHTITPDGLMQRGHSKDHRPDLPQLKLMAAAAQPTSHMLACDIVPGQSADDPLYLPLIRRVRQQLRQHGLLYSGDCKMSALATRAELVAEKDYYLMPLPRTGDNAEQIEAWIEQAALGKQPLQDLTRVDEKGKRVVFARTYERQRSQSSTVAEREVAWTERVQVIRSLELAKRQAKQLDERLGEAVAALVALTPPVGRGHKQYREEEALLAAVAAIEEEHRVSGLLTVTWQREEQQQSRYRGRGRGGPGRPKYTTTKVRYVITEAQRNEAAIEEAKARQGWRVQVTNLPVSRWSLREAVLLYNGGWSVERDFHLLKDQPLGIQPLFVREEEQIVGLTRLLTIALRVLTLSELQVRSGLSESEEALSGLYEGQPHRTTAYPTAGRCLKAINRMEITATRVESGEDVQWHVTDLPPLLKRIMKLLHLSPTLYTRLAKAAA